MRFALLLLPVALCASGCSALIINSGHQLSELTTREQVQKSFGVPEVTGGTEDQNFEEFFTRQKIAEPDKGIYLCMGYAWTFGLGEFIWFPREFFFACRHSIEGQTLRFEYDQWGRVINILRNGERVPWGPVYPLEGDSEPAKAN